MMTENFIKFKRLYGIGKVTKVATYFKYMQTVMFETVVHCDDKRNVFTATRCKSLHDGKYTDFKWKLVDAPFCKVEKWLTDNDFIVEEF